MPLKTHRTLRGLPSSLLLLSFYLPSGASEDAGCQTVGVGQAMVQLLTRRGRMQSQQAVRTQNLNYVSNHNKGCKVKREVCLLPLPPTPHPTAGSSDGCGQTVSGPDIQPGRSRGRRTGHHWGFLYARLAFQRHLRSDLSSMVGHFETYMMRNTTSKEFKRARNASQSSDLESSIKASLQARW